MERTVPSTASEEIELYQRTYYSLLRSSAEVRIRTLEEAHARMNSQLHVAAREPVPDMSAFIYCLLRLPACMPKVRLVILGQTNTVFEQRGFGNVESWEQVSTQARRRRCFFDRKETLAFYIASRTDIDDVIPLLTAYQIEWNKIHAFLQVIPTPLSISNYLEDEGSFAGLAQMLKISLDDLVQLKMILGTNFEDSLQEMAIRSCDLRVQSLGGSLSDYWRATHIWWENIERSFPGSLEHPIYFISSNPHSMVNLLSGYASLKEEELLAFLHRPENGNLFKEWEKIKADRVPSSLENFFYYVLKKYQQDEDKSSLPKAQTDHECECGITRIPSERSFDVEAQVIEFRHLRPEWFDPRLDGDLSFIPNSDALILNIDYPLGLAAYNILAKVAEHTEEILGVYVTGKAAILNGVIGDVMIPNVVHDEQSRNTYLFQNAFAASDVAPYVIFGTVLDNQKAVSVRGTFLQNANYMDVFYREGYTDIEMEAGPYLSAVYEMYRPQRHPVNEVVNLYGLSFDLGVIHYASDTPLGKGKNLGAGSLSYFGMDATYGVSVAILRRIFQLERKRLQTQRNPRG